MGKWLRRLFVVALLAVFLFSAQKVISIVQAYRAGQQTYDTAVEAYVQPQSTETTDVPLLELLTPELPGEETPTSSVYEAHEEVPTTVTAPITVDFDALQAAGQDVVGWIYCEDTIINYPVVQGADNDYYLHRSYDGSYSYPGSIFVEATNSPEFQDGNTLIYGHNMKDNTMFASLESWADQSFYDQHPIIWLLTPTQDYAIVLLSGHATVADSPVYAVLAAPGQETDAYIAETVAQSDFQAAAEPQAGNRYVLLSTCAYSSNNARYVLHGMLVPVASAGGVPLE